MLSPVPQATSAPAGTPIAADASVVTCPATSVGPRTAGSFARSRSISSSTPSSYASRSGRPPAGSRGVAAVGDRAAREPLGHVVVRQAHARDLRCQVRLLATEPEPRRGGEGGDGDAADPGRARLRAAEQVRQPRRVGRRPGVVPQDRGTERTAILAEHDESVLLAGDRDRGHLRAPARAGDRLRERIPPDLGRRLPRAALAGHDVGRLARGHDRAALRVDEHDLGRLGRAVDSGDESWHGRVVWRTPRKRTRRLQ